MGIGRPAAIVSPKILADVAAAAPAAAEAGKEPADPAAKLGEKEATKVITAAAFTSAYRQKPLEFVNQNLWSAAQAARLLGLLNVAVVRANRWGLLETVSLICGRQQGRTLQGLSPGTCNWCVKSFGGACFITGC